jgi:hypothetical protein
MATVVAAGVTEMKHLRQMPVVPCPWMLDRVASHQRSLPINDDELEAQRAL